MTLSRMIVDKLGINLYDRASAVITELVSNAYDADATEVTVEIPLGQRLGWKKGKRIESSDHTIIVCDNGHGMVPRNITPWYLMVGYNRRIDKKRAKSPRFKRPVTGRKGIGKFAPFGICQTIEVISAGGKPKKKKYLAAHFIMKYDEILQPETSTYKPKIGPLDDTWVDWHGTRIILSDFLNRTVPSAETFRRMLARKFGLSQESFKIYISDTSPDADSTPTMLDPLDVPIREETKIDLQHYSPFQFEGVTYPMKGWVAYSRKSYRDEAMAGIRVYVREKMAAAIRDFGIQSGFTGEFTMRSYLVGVIHAEWLDHDDGDDLIQTHRHDIQWGSDIGRAFQEWGQQLITKLAKDSQKSDKKRKADRFLEISQLRERARQAYADKVIQETVLKFGNVIAGMTSEDSLENPQHVENLADLAIAIGPHMMLLERLQKVSDLDEGATLDILLEIFADERTASSASMGAIAKLKVQSIMLLDDYINKADPPPIERKLQALLEASPWLVYPGWTVLSEDETFAKFRQNLRGWWKRVHGEDIATSTMDAADMKRPDFIMIHYHEGILIIEIKRPGHALNDEDAKRLDAYIVRMQDFFKANSKYEREIGRFRVILVCDQYKTTRSWTNTIKLHEKEGILEKKTWTRVLKETQAAHSSFVSAWEAQQRLVRQKEEAAVEELIEIGS